MSFLDILKMAAGNFLRRKARTLLTVAGVVIGTMAVVIMISIGQGLEQGYTEQLKSWGSLTQIEVYRNYSSNTEEQKYLDENLIIALDDLDHVVAALPQTSKYGALVMGKKINDLSFIGIDANKLEYYDIELENGEPLTQEMLSDSNYLIGYRSVFNFYDPKKGWTDENSAWDDDGNIKPLPFDPLNPETKIKMVFDTNYYWGGGGSKPKSYDVNCTGVISQKSNNFGWAIVMDMNSLDSIYKKYAKSANIDLKENEKNQDKYDTVYVEVDDMNNVTSVQQEINDMGYGTWSSTELLDDVKDQMGMIQAVLGGIGAVAFLVAAIGISNTMVMSTYERTREIGIMKVLGCKLSNIMLLFLLEAAIIGLAGGVLGIAFSMGVSALLNYFSSSGVLAMFSMGDGIPISVIPIWLIVCGIGFSTLVGLLSGMYPAWRATRLPALDAIKNE
jgi:ABC-type antimicrobial peptide transport system permease subunit